MAHCNLQKTRFVVSRWNNIANSTYVPRIVWIIAINYHINVHKHIYTDVGICIFLCERSYTIVQLSTPIRYIKLRQLILIFLPPSHRATERVYRISRSLDVDRDIFTHYDFIHTVRRYYTNTRRCVIIPHSSTTLAVSNGASIIGHNVHPCTYDYKTHIESSNQFELVVQTKSSDLIFFPPKNSHQHKRKFPTNRSV